MGAQMIALLLLSIVPHDDVIRESCDVLWLEHFYDEQGRLVFDQLIFLDWTGERYDVRAWRLIKHPIQLPFRDPSGRYAVLFQDGETTRRIEALSFRESWDQYDPELHEREKLPKEFRRELRAAHFSKGH